MTKTRKKKLSEDVRSRLEAIITGCSEDKRLQAELLIENIAFQAAELADLRENISENGAITMVRNGNNITTLNANPAVRTYNTLMKTFNNTLAQLRTVLPETAVAGSALMDFIRGGKPDE